MADAEAKILRHATHLITTDGWFQTKQTPGTDTHCLFTALNLAALELLPTAGIIAHIETATTAITRLTGSNSLMKWNDTPGRTKDEVLDVLRQAAKHEAQN